MLVLAACTSTGSPDTTGAGEDLATTVASEPLASEPTTPPPTATPTTAPPSTNPPATDAPTTADADSSPDGSAGPDAETASGGGDACLIGSWQVDNTVFASELADLYAESGLSAEVSVDGQSIVEFRDGGSFTGGYDDFIAEVAAEGVPTIQISFEGAGEGSWGAEGGTLSMTPESFDIAAEATVGGAPMGDLGYDIGDLALYETTDTPYTCDDQRLTLQIPGGIDYQAERVD